MQRLVSAFVFAVAAGSMPGGLLAQPADQEPKPVLRPQREVEQDMRRVYAKFFKRTKNPQMHEQGWREMERFLGDPRVYQLMLDLFKDKPIEMRRQVLEFFVNAASDDADVVIAWVAVFDDDPEMRTWAAGRLIERVGEEEPSQRVQRVIEAGLSDGHDDPAVASAQLASRFGLLKAIPYLIQAQAQPRGRGNVREGAIAQIVVGTQQAFVANLTPVVANNAVGFQPTIGVVTNGVVLRVMDATVWAYRTEVHRSLVSMTSDAWGRSTASMGYDQQQWYQWYENEFVPFLAAQKRG
ncbi:MAG TPA: hypothetical protein ENJ00_02250 [Phycisphaerales bacterium]|nr:hypothetical protein [Phycisphaerales bacterium]